MVRAFLRADTHIDLQLPDNAVEATFNKEQVVAAISVSLGSMIIGFVSGYTSPASVSMKNLESQYFPVSEQAVSWIGGIMPLAALLGGIIGGPLIDFLGRRTIILHTAIPFIVSSLLIACAVDVAYVLIGRAIAGICVGILSLSLPVYLGETLQPEVRGTLGLLPTALGNTGILICFLAGKYLNWWELAFLGAALPVPFLILMTIIPETPRWYFSKGKPEKARKSLQKMRGKKADITAEFHEIEKTIEASNKERSESVLKDLFSPTCLKPLVILIGLMFFQQMSGINAVIFYTVTIFKDAGSSIDENLCTIIVGIVNFGSTFLATALIDKAGRKILLYVSNVSMTLTLGTLGTFFYYKNCGVDVSDYGWLPLVSFVIYVIGFSLGFGPVPWLMVGEILPAKVRGSAASLTAAFNWMCTFIVTKAFSDIIACLGSHGAFWMFCGICFVAFFFVYFFVPETRGKSLEDIERKFASTSATRRLSSIANLKPSPLSV
ncbi:Facilitated trehalose transporter Tret1 [Polyplax serrata]|uniref:Facilitated trehalose transporter Tret1 n=1 Tax=Polyplax serrata TaxID=468196 RepID=A0ABR1AF49_POLSC